MKYIFAVNIKLFKELNKKLTTRDISADHLASSFHSTASKLSRPPGQGVRHPSCLFCKTLPDGQPPSDQASVSVWCHPLSSANPSLVEP